MSLVLTEQISDWMCQMSRETNITWCQRRMIESRCSMLKVSDLARNPVVVVHYINLLTVPRVKKERKNERKKAVFIFCSPHMWKKNILVCSNSQFIKLGLKLVFAPAFTKCITFVVIYSHLLLHYNCTGICYSCLCLLFFKLYLYVYAILYTLVFLLCLVLMSFYVMWKAF